MTNQQLNYSCEDVGVGCRPLFQCRWMTRKKFLKSLNNFRYGRYSNWARNVPLLLLWEACRASVNYVISFLRKCERERKSERERVKERKDDDDERERETTTANGRERDDKDDKRERERRR